MIKILVLFALAAVALADYGTYQATEVDKSKEVYVNPGAYVRQHAPRYNYARYSGGYSPYEFMSGGVYSQPDTYNSGAYNRRYTPYQYGTGRLTADTNYGYYDSASHNAHEPYKHHGYGYY